MLPKKRAGLSKSPETSSKAISTMAQTLRNRHVRGLLVSVDLLEKLQIR